MEQTILNKYIEKKNQEEQFSNHFEKLLETLLNKLDIVTFERTISKVVADGYILSVNGVSYKLCPKSIDLVNQLYKMFSQDNIKHPISSYSDNNYICNFLEEQREYFNKNNHENNNNDLTPEEENLLKNNIKLWKKIVEEAHPDIETFVFPCSMNSNWTKEDLKKLQELTKNLFQ